MGNEIKWGHMVIVLGIWGYWDSYWVAVGELLCMDMGLDLDLDLDRTYITMCVYRYLLEQPAVQMKSIDRINCNRT